jgi:hypothetical protein
VQFITSPPMEKFLVHRKSSFHDWTGRPPSSHDCTGRGIMCAPWVGVASILAGREDYYAHVQCAILSSRPIPVWRHRPTSRRARLVCLCSHLLHVCCKCCIYCLRLHRSNYDAGTKQAWNRPNSLQHAHKYANVNAGRDSVVGIATRYGLDNPGIEPRWGARFSADLPWGPPNL